MSQPRSRSPLHSRNSGVPGRLTDGFYGEQYHSTVHSDQWRSSENSSKMEGSAHRDNTYVHGEQEVDHWAQFIEAIGRAGRQQHQSPAGRQQHQSPAGRQQHHTSADIQRYEEKPSNSPRRLPRERLPSPGTLRYGADPHQRIPSLLQHRSEHGVAFLGRHDSNRPNWDSKGSASGDLLGNKRDWIEHEYRNEAEEDRYQRSSFSERSQKSNYREQPSLPKRFRGLDPQEEHSGSYRAFSPQKGMVIVEHDHGISKHLARSRDLPHGRDPLRTEHPRSRDPPRSSDLPWDRDHPRTTESQVGRDIYRRNDPSRSRETLRNRRVQGHHGGMMHDRQSGPSNYHIREEMRIGHSTDGRNLVQGRSRPREQPRSEFSSRESHGHIVMDLSNQEDLRSDRNNRPRASGPAWEDETEHGRNHGIRPGQGHPRHRNNPVGGTERETLRIKVDMSRPVGHSSYMGYSSERQLSLDLVNVGRQRLDFLPMLKHSGTYKESAMHTGTFAQEIITLVHHVKENYFQGQGISLNERFSNKQHYSLVDELSEGEQELEEIGHVINRPLGNPSSDTQIFCKIGSIQPQRRQVPDPSDLRYNLEMKRQQRLEGVKITIAGGNFSQIVPQGRESPSVCVIDRETHKGKDDGWSDDWSEQLPPETGQQRGPNKKRNKADFNAKWSFSGGARRSGQRMRRYPNEGAS